MLNPYYRRTVFMPSINKEQEALLLSARDERKRAQLGASIEAASKVDPNTAPEKIALQQEYRVPFGTVERNTDMLLERREVDAVKSEDLYTQSPATARYMTDQNNAYVSSDDTRTLSQLEASIGSGVPFWSNNMRLLMDRTSTVMGRLVEFSGMGASAFEEMSAKGGVSWAQDSQMGETIQAYGRGIATAGSFKSQSNFSWERLKGEVTPSNLAGYIVEQGIFGSAPDMAAAIVALPAYIASRSTELATDRAAGEPIGLTEVMQMLPVAVATALMERLGTRITLGMDEAAGPIIGKAAAAKAVGKAGAAEGGLEFAQEGLEYLGVNAFTEQGVDFMDMLDQSLAGMVAGGPVGAAMRTPSAAAEAVSNARIQRGVRRQESSSAQQSIDSIITLAQSSRTNERAKGQMEEFVAGVSDNDAVFLSPEFLDNIPEGMDIPGSIFMALNSGSDQDVTIPMKEFVTSVASNPELAAAMRPYLRRTDATMTQSEMSQFDDKQMDDLVTRAQKDTDLHTEAKTVFEDVKAKLGATDLYTKEEVGLMSSVYPAYATVIAKERGISISEAYGVMNMDVTKMPEAAPREPGVVLSQATSEGYEGTDVAEATEWSAATAKFGAEGMTTEARMVRAQEMGFDTESPLFHGTADDVREFDLSHPNRHDAGWLGAGVYLTNSPKTAAAYANIKSGQAEPNTVQVVHRLQNPYVADGEVDEKARIKRIEETEGAEAARAEAARWTAELQAQGYDGVVFPYRRTAMVPTRRGGELEPDNELEVVVFDPKNIRSINAAFDPDAAESGSLLAQSPVPTDLTVADSDLGKTYTDDAGNTISVMEDSPYSLRPNSVTEFVVPKENRGKGEGRKLLAKILSVYDKNSISASASSAASVKLFYEQGFRPAGKLDATLAEAEAIRVDYSSVTMVIPTARDTAFLNWFGDSKVVDESGDPVVVYHGTTHSFDEFNKGRANVENDMGAGFYFSNTPGDVGVNYAGEGPDLTSRIERRAEQIVGSAYDDAESQEYLETRLPSDFESATAEDLDVAAQALARAELSGDAPNTMPVYLNIRNPLVLGGDNETTFEIEFDEETEEESGSAIEFMEAVQAVAGDFDIDAQEVISALELYEPMTASELIDTLQGAGVLAYAVDEQGDIAGSEFLRAVFEEMGFDGIIDSTVDRKFGSQRRIGRPMEGMNPDTVHYIAFRPEQIKSAIGNDGTFDANDPSVLSQDDRAGIQILDNKRVILLSQASDLSSFLHESAHLFLEVEKQLAAKSGVTDRQQKMLDWLGVEKFEDIDPTTPDGVALHEKFAEGFETYLFEGTAPSLELREAFAAFGRWLRQIYRAISPYSALNAEGRQVFDSMLATDAQIEEAAASGVYEELFKTQAQSGMTDKEWAAYQRKAQRRKELALETLDEKVLRQLRARRTKEWREERAPMIQEEKARLSDLTIYQAIQAMRSYPMDSAMVKALFPEGFPARLKPRVKQGGVDPAEYAEQFGYPSAEAMLKEMIATPNLDAAAMEAAQARMLEIHGDILNDGSIEAEARTAVENDTHADLLYDEAAALARAARRPVINRELLKAQAARAVSQMNTTEVAPNKFYRAEIKAAVKAATATDPAAKLAAQIQRLANHYLYTEAVKAQKDAIKYQKYLKGVQDRNYDTRIVDAGYVNAMKQLVNQYDFRANPKKRRERARKVYEWYKGQADAGVILMDSTLADFAEAINDGVSAEFLIPTMNELTMDALRSTYDMARHLRFKGGKIAESASTEIKETRQELIEGMEKTAKKVELPPDQPDLKAEGKTVWSHMLNLLPSLRNQIRNLDGFSKNDYGPWAKHIYSKVAEGTGMRLALAKEFYGNYAQLMQGISALGIYRGEDTKRTITKEDGSQFTLDRVGRFMLASYWGTESSREAIRLGHNATDNDVGAMLSLMSAQELDLVNELWAANEKMWPKLSEAALKRDGVAPPKLTPTPFAINGVTLTGGHMRLIYEDHADEIRDGSTRLDHINSVIPGKAASTMARVGSGGKRVRLDPGNIYRAVDDNIHFIAFSEIGTRLQALVNNKDVKATMVATRGVGFQRAFAQNITGLTTNAKEREVVPALAKLANWSRHAKSAMYLAYNMKNIIQQVGSAPQVVDEVGALPFLQETGRMMYNPRAYMDNVNELSVQMRDRAEKITREHAEVTKRQMFSSKGAQAYNTFIQHGFTPHVIFDMAFSYPTWTAKYNSQMLEHGDQKRAVTAADVSVAESVGSGLDLNMGKALQSNQGSLVKLMTVFGSWFNSTSYQRMYRDTKGGDEFTSRRAFMSLALIPMLSAVTASVVVFDTPDMEGGGDEEFWKWLALRYTSYVSASFILVRDAVAVVNSGFVPQTPLQDLLEIPSDVKNLATRAATGEMTPAKVGSSAIKAVGTLVPLPGSGNIVRMLDHIDAVQQGNEPERSVPGHLIHGFVEGPDRNRVK